MTNQRFLAAPMLGKVARMAVLTVLAACSGGQAQIPEPRPIVNFGGARIRVERDRMQEVHDWVTREDLNMEEDPTFMVDRTVVVGDVYPWEHVEFASGTGPAGGDEPPDTVRVPYDPASGDAFLVNSLYGHMHLMVRLDRQAEWLPEAPTATGYDLERAILSRVADAWLLGRTVFDTAPYGPLDELMYAKEAGYLDAFIFTARPNEFVEARSEWARAEPDEAERYRAWFTETFNREPPGIRQP